MSGAASFEASLRTLVRRLQEQDHTVPAGSLLEVIPESGVVRNGEQRELLAERLRRVADVDDVAAPLRAEAARLAEVAADAMGLRGRAGTVWIAWEDGDERPRGPSSAEPCYVVSWQSERGDDDWWEDGPASTELRVALAWARERSDSVVVRPSWDVGTHYWAGSGPDRRNLPPLGDRRA